MSATDLSDIRTVLEETDSSTVNRMLDNGWRLLGVQAHTDHAPVYVLGYTETLDAYRAARQ